MIIVVINLDVNSVSCKKKMKEEVYYVQSQFVYVIFKSLSLFYRRTKYQIISISVYTRLLRSCTNLDLRHQ